MNYCCNTPTNPMRTKYIDIFVGRLHLKSMLRPYISLFHLMVNIIDEGFLHYNFQRLLKRAIVAPSTTQWSPPQDMGMIQAALTSSELSLANCGSRFILPIAVEDMMMY